MSTVKEHLENGRYFRTWHSKSRSAKGVVMIIHGLGEHCERYDALAQFFNANGYHVASMDLPCHGRSDGPRGHIDDFDTYQEALYELKSRIHTDYPKLPIVLLGHSMGGLIAARILLTEQDEFACAVLSGAAIQSPQEPPAWQVSIIRLIASVFSSLKVLELDAQGISRDQAVVDKYFADPLVSKEKLSARFLVAMFSAMKEVKTNAGVIKLPLMVLHGGEDNMTDPEGSRLLYNRVCSNEKALKIYPGLYHEIFNEPEATSIYQEVLDWVNNVLAQQTKSKRA